MNKPDNPKTDISIIIAGNKAAAAKTQTESETVRVRRSCRQAIAKNGRNRRILPAKMTDKMSASYIDGMKGCGQMNLFK